MCGHTPLASWLLAFGFGCTLRTMTTGCVFCSIVEGTAAAERVYEDDFVVAIMDIHPATAGHVLVIPRNHSQDLWHIGREPAEVDAPLLEVHVGPPELADRRRAVS